MNSSNKDASVTIVDRPDGDAMDALCETLHALALETDRSGDWPRRQLEVCGRAGVFRWFMPTEAGGFGWDACDQTRGYLRLAAADLTTTFVITQRMGACRRIESSENASPAKHWLSGLVDGSQFATVGISHLTTSRQHVRRPVLTAEEDGDDFVLSGYSPWVTGGAFADVIVVGATLPDERQLLAAVPGEREGVIAGKGMPLIALSASATDRVDFDNVRVYRHELIAGPVPDVMSQGVGAASGGLQTSTLAIGLASAAIQFMQQEAEQRDDLRSPTDQLVAEVNALETDLLRMANGDDVCSTADLRGRANRLVLRATQAALTTAKGAGFVQGHPAGRWCIEALFFLVWSCPQQSRPSLRTGGHSA
ncbi:MAG: acyl-CoA dehydrogenase family protein [Pirellulaceae bacterium]